MSIPRPDPNFTMAELRKVAERFRDIGREYWEAAHKAGIGGAVVWAQMDDGSMVIFTRHEYRETLMRNIHEIGTPRTFGGVSEP